MAGDLTVRRGGWQVKNVRSQAVGLQALPTMADTGEVDLRGFLRTIYRGKWILILTMAASMGATLYWMLHAVPLYSADVLIVIEARPSSIVKVDQAVQDISADTAKVDTEVAVLKSRGVAARVVRDLELDKDPEFAPTALAGADLARGSAGEPASSDGFPAKTYLRSACSSRSAGASRSSRTRSARRRF